MLHAPTTHFYPRRYFRRKHVDALHERLMPKCKRDERPEGTGVIASPLPVFINHLLQICDIEETFRFPCGQHVPREIEHWPAVAKYSAWLGAVRIS